MEIFKRFNRKNIQDRQVDTLIGLSKGLVADGIINQMEAEFLLNWLIQNQEYSDNPVVGNLLMKVEEFLADNVLDQEEQQELLQILNGISGASAGIGELTKTTSLPLDQPFPEIVFRGASFLFTGTCVYGTRKECQREVERLGGVNAKSVTQDLNYLVLGTYVTDSWAHESFGRKIEKAVAYRDKGLPLSIVSEEHWVNEAGI